MDPDDSFSPPLDGLSRGKKLQQILTTFRNSENVQATHYSKASEESDSTIAAFINIDDFLDESVEGNNLGILTAGWWHMRREPDWWEFTYLEIDGERLQEIVERTEEADEPGDEQSTLVDEEEEQEFSVPMQNVYQWARQPKEDSPDMTYFAKMEGGEWEYEEFETEIESPKPLSKAMINEYLPAKLRETHASDD